MKFDKVIDSGERQEFDTGSRRDTDIGKGKPSQISVWGLIRLAKHYENGAKKYGIGNWTKGQPISRYLDSAFRHMIKFMGRCTSEDHLAAIAWNILAIIDHQERIERGLLNPKLDDMNNYPQCFLPDEFDPKPSVPDQVEPLDNLFHTKWSSTKSANSSSLDFAVIDEASPMSEETQEALKNNRALHVMEED